MREIKFRAWDKKENKYNLWKEILDWCDFSWIFGETKEEDGYGSGRFIVEQFTGLHDKNGVEIYDGDIIKAEVYKKIKLTEDEDFYGSDGYKRELSSEEWTIEYKERFNQGNGFYCYGKNRRFSTKLTGSKILNCNLEVIGNIHERSKQDEENK